MPDLKERSSDISSTRTVYADPHVMRRPTPFFEQPLAQKKRQFLKPAIHQVELAAKPEARPETRAGVRPEVRPEARLQLPARVEVAVSPIKPRFSLPAATALSNPVQELPPPHQQEQQVKRVQQVQQVHQSPGRLAALGEAQPHLAMVAHHPYVMMPQPVAAPLFSMPSAEPLTQLKQQQGRRKQKKPRAKMTRGRLMRRALIVCSILTIIAVVFMSQANGSSGAGTADLLRGVVGPTITAQVESWYLGLTDKTQQVQYSLSGQHVAAPWNVDTVATMPTLVTPPKASPLLPMPLHRIAPMVTPALAGEGVWATQGMAPAPYGYLPLDARAFIRSDPTRPYAIVTLLQFDTRFFRLHMVAGTTEPGGPRGFNGPGVIPANDQKGNALLAAFNGGFKFADGQYGLKTNGVVYVPPQPGAATIAVTKSGHILLGAWGLDPRLNSGNADLVAWRQNAALLIDHGTINPLTQDGAAWGGTILNAAYTWRSGIGITAHGTLIYAAGSSLTALTLGEALKAAGAVMAMQTDINPFWVRAFLYSRNAGGTLSISKLNPAMYGTGTEYLSATERDFFYMTRFAPPLPLLLPTRPREVFAQ